MTSNHAMVMVLGLTLVGAGLGGFFLMKPKPAPPPEVFEDHKNGIVCYVSRRANVYQPDTISCVKVAK